MNDAYKLILSNIRDGKIDRAPGLALLELLRASSLDEKSVAIVGMSGVFAGTEGLEDLWDAVVTGADLVGRLPKARDKDLEAYLERDATRFTTRLQGGFLRSIDQFDSRFFKMSPKESALTTPAHRLFWQVACDALSDAGLPPENVRGLRIGSYVGFCDYLYENYAQMIFAHAPELLRAGGVSYMPAMMQGRLHRFLGVSGPTILVDTACSSSAVAVALACDDLRAGKVDLAIAAGVRVNNMPVEIDMLRLGLESRDYRSRTFDDSASGAGTGEGVGAIALKRLSDAIAAGDRIYAVIRGYAINNESGGASPTAPTTAAQCGVIEEAWSDAGVNPAEIGYLELHGTGTKLGDGVEFMAVRSSFAIHTDQKAFCAVGSVKSGFGHLNEAAGILGVIKAALTLERKVLPPSVHFQKPNALIDLADSALYLNVKARRWESSRPRLAGVNAFGISGSNCHIVLEEAPPSDTVRVAIAPIAWHKARCWYLDYVPTRSAVWHKYAWKPYAPTGTAGFDHACWLAVGLSKKNARLEAALSRVLDLRVSSIDDSAPALKRGQTIIVGLLGDDRNYQCDSLHRLVAYFKRLIERYPDDAFRVVAVCSGVFSVSGEVNADYRRILYLGYLKVLCKELSNSTLTVLDIGGEPPEEAANAASRCDKEFVAFRGGALLTREFERVNPEASPTPPIKRDGVYAFIGGAGGLGMACAKALLEREPTARIALIGRSGADSVAHALAQFGSSASYYQADVADADQINAAFASISRDFGAIDGVIHSAGVENDRPIKTRPAQDLIDRAVLLPKVRGMENLASLLIVYKPDFFVFFSSAASVFPLVGQSDYIAANMYGEAFCEWLSAKGVRASSVLWSTWRETGMAFRRDAAIDTIFKTVGSNEGANAFLDFLSFNETGLLYGSVNGDKGMSLMRLSMVNFADNEGVSAKRPPSAHPAAASRRPLDPPLVVGGSTDPLIGRLASIVNRYLGLTSVSSTESLFEMGVDSVSLIKIRDDIERQLGVDVPLAVLFENSSIEKMASLIMRGKAEIPAHPASRPPERNHAGAIAIIGISYCIPCCDEGGLLDALERGGDFSNTIHGERRRDIDNYLAFRGFDAESVAPLEGSFLARVDQFDYAFFGISPAEAKLMAPEHRLALESAFHAADDAGYGAKLMGMNAAVYTAYSPNPRDSYGSMILECRPGDMAYAELGVTPSAIAGRISHFFDLKGPALNVDSACSSSLAALCEAVQGLRAGRFNMALVQGVKVCNLPFRLQDQQAIGMTSTDGKTRTLGRYASGFSAAEGVITLVLKPLDAALESRDRIYAVVSGVAANHNGARPNMASSSLEQQRLLSSETLRDAGLSPGEVGFVEMHGTATVIGDSVEFAALSGAFSGVPRSSRPVGSVKANLGHASEAAGLYGVAKAALMIFAKKLPPLSGFGEPNPVIHIEESPFFVNAKPRLWDSDSRVALVTALGINGTNAQCALQNVEQPTDHPAGSPLIFTLSARQKPVLTDYVKKFISYLSENDPDLARLSYSLAVGRAHHPYRLAFEFTGKDDLVRRLKCAREDSLSERSGEYCYGHADQRPSGISSVGLELSEICRLYAGGADVDWQSLFPTGLSPISLPEYPFARTRVWLDIPEAAPQVDDMFMELRWIPDESPLCPVPVVGRNPNLLVVALSGESDSLRSGLAGAARRVYKNVRFAEESDNDHRSFTDPYDLLFIAWPPDKEIGSLSELKEIQRRATAAFISEIDSLVAFAKGAPVRCAIVVRNAFSVDGEPCQYWNSTLIGLGMCVSHEYTNISCGLYDLDSLDYLYMRFADFTACRGRLVRAVRQRRLYSRSMKAQNPRPAPGLANYRDGAYIVTGGFSGVGLLIAGDLAYRGAKHIALIGSKRSYADPELTRMSRLGASVACYDIDIGDEQALSRTLADIRQRSERITGIFHCAGRSDSGLIINKPLADVDSVFSGKVYGGWLLQKLTEQDGLDFLLCFSSEIITNGEAGQAAYTAANLFIHEMCESAGRHSPLKSLAWTTWRDVGMGKRLGVNRDMIFKTIDNKTGLAAIRRGLQYGTRAMVVGRPNEAFFAQTSGKLSSIAVKVDPSLIAHHGLCAAGASYDYKLLGDIPERSRQKLLRGERVSHTRLAGAADYSETEQAIALCFSKTLGFDEIDVNQSFFEMGGDSILLSRLHAMIIARFPNSVKLQDLFQYSTVTAIASRVSQSAISQTVAHRAASLRPGAVAIIGCDFNLPGADSWDDLNDVLSGAIVAESKPSQKRISLFNRLTLNKTPMNRDNSITLASLDNIDEFDHAFFGIDKLEADALDPAARLMITSVRRALESAGYADGFNKTDDASLYMGYTSFSEYTQALLPRKPVFPADLSSNQTARICGRIASMFGIRGGAYALDTACSSSLAAMHMACNDIRGTSKIAVVVCANLRLNLRKEQTLEVGYETRDGATRTLDDTAGGTGVSEGVVTMILRDAAVENGDGVLGVVIGSAINGNGRGAGITVPDQISQKAVLIEAWERAGINPELIRHVELHGTGTKLGDTIEACALDMAFKEFTPRRGFCAVSSAKANFGHAQECAGLVGLLKTLLIINNGSIFPSANFALPNRDLPLIDSALYVSAKNESIADAEAYYGVSSFGISGVNCHIVLSSQHSGYLASSSSHARRPLKKTSCWA